jgi:hypothetical protein
VFPTDKVDCERGERTLVSLLSLYSFRSTFSLLYKQLAFVLFLTLLVKLALTRVCLIIIRFFIFSILVKFRSKPPEVLSFLSFEGVKILGKNAHQH